MIYSYSIKPIVLNTVTLPQACAQCGHENTVLTIYKKYLQICWVLMIPIRRNCSVRCPHCGHYANRKQFLAQLQKSGKDAEKIKEKLKSLVKSAKTPLYPKILFGCLALIVSAIIVVTAYDKRQSAASVAEYCASPHNNVLLIVKHEEEKFPYEILYIPKIEQDQAVILPSKYAYKRQNDAEKALAEIKRAIAQKDVSNVLQESLEVDTQTLLSFSIVYVGSVATKIEWSDTTFPIAASEKL